jgi:polyisoprenoid-binding protein YceI
MGSIIWWIAATATMSSAAASAQPQAIDTQKSVMTVHVYKSGVFSAFAHDHEISAPIASGSVDASAHRVELRLGADTLRVRERDVSEKDRTEIQETMLGPQVLDAAHNREIVFRSTTVEPAGPGSWTVQGNLTLHGTERPVTLTVSEHEGHYTGSAALKQTAFGIKPVRIAGGTVRVKDEVRIEFDIQLAR